MPQPESLQRELDRIVGETVRNFSAGDNPTLASVDADDRRIKTSGIVNRTWKKDIRTWPLEEQVALVQEFESWYGRATIEGENILALNNDSWEEAVSELLKNELQYAIEAFLERLSPTGNQQAEFTDDLLFDHDWGGRDELDETHVFDAVNDLANRVKKKDPGKRRDFSHDLTADHELVTLWTPAAQVKAVRLLVSEYNLSDEEVLKNTTLSDAAAQPKATKLLTNDGDGESVKDRPAFDDTRWDELIPVLLRNTLQRSVLIELDRQETESDD